MSDPRPTAALPEQIGPYRIHELIEDGDCGTVYLAAANAAPDDRVRLRVLPVGVADSDARARFAIVQRALAQVRHPGVAPVLDAGSTAVAPGCPARPYFVMPRADGDPILAGCDRRRLRIDARIELFRTVCDAVQHAHLHGVIHGELTPAQVTIVERDGRLVPTVGGFGVAISMSAVPGRAIGTPASLSPEQVGLEGTAVDARTDVHALGVLLHALLVGELPFARERAADDGGASLRRALQETLPVRPSARLAALGPAARGIASARRIGRLRLRRKLRDDLDAIVLKALATHPDDRYATPRELADDLLRHRAHEPVAAVGPRGGYRLRKLVRRRPATVSFATLLISSAVAGAVVATVQLQDATSERELLATSVARATRTAEDANEKRSLAAAEVRAAHDAQIRAEGLAETAQRELEAARAELVRAHAAREDALEAAMSAQRELAAADAALAEQRARADALGAWSLLGVPAQIDDLIARHDALRGSGPDQAPAIAAWLRDARELLGRRTDAQRALDAIRAREPAPARDDGHAEPALAFLHAGLSRVVARLDELESGPLQESALSFDWATHVDAWTREHPNATVSWGQAADTFAQSPVYAAARGDGSPARLAPQTGLVPIGVNPRTGLLEFYDLRSAWDGRADPSTLAIPAHAADGSIDIDAASGIVFVLLPGGESAIGAQRRDPRAPNFDPNAGDTETVRTVRVRPFFIARHELTQAQWARLWDGEPSGRWPSREGSKDADPTHARTAMHPVESVDLVTCLRVVGEHGLTLPTEIEWEYACRAGTSTPWWCGQDEARLGDLENITPHGAASAGRHTDAVGMHAANPFGLFDVHGNVSEWCRSADSGLGTTRGGAFRAGPAYARATAARRYVPRFRDELTGLRVARTLNE